jgi:hypothetical protein
MNTVYVVVKVDNDVETYLDFFSTYNGADFYKKQQELELVEEEIECWEEPTFYYVKDIAVRQ